MFSVTVSLCGVSEQAVETVNTELLGCDAGVTFFDLALFVGDFLLFLLKFADEFVEFLLEELVLGGGVEVIDLDS